MTDKIKNLIHMLRQSIYTGERRLKQLAIVRRIGYIICIIGAVTTIMNIVQHKGAVTYTTMTICIAGILISFVSSVFKDIRVALCAAWFFCVVIFSYYAISGTNEGFAILWTLMVPLAFGYFAGIFYGLTVSFYYELLFIVLFYTPIHQKMAAYYTETFMQRYPILYLTSILLNAVTMISNHISTLMQMEYEVKLKEALKVAEEESRHAQAANDAKSTFLSNMSHEIRTPINAVLGMNEMILRECETEDILSYSENIKNAGNTLLGIVNDILDFSKIEAGKIEIIPVEYDLSSVINDLVNMIQVRADDKGLELKLDFRESIPKQLFGDEIRIKQIITNILTNAVKYTEKGSVTFGIDYEKTDDPEIILMKVSVKDTGIGIKKEDINKLFSEFDRIEEKRNRNIEGTGLGMSITKSLLEMMGSSLDLDSVYGEGSEFSFAIKQKVISDEPLGNYGESYRAHVSRHKKYKEKFTAPDARVLVVDDNPMNLIVFKSLIKKTLVQVDTAEDGVKGLVLADRNKYDVIFLDHMMPGKDGIETLHELKAKTDGINIDTPTICLTANAISGAKEAYVKEGFIGYLSKPVDADELEDMLLHYIPDEKIMSPGPDEDKNAQQAPAADEDDELASIDGDLIDIKEGIRLSGGKEPYMGLMKIFYDSIDERYEEIDNFYKAKDLKNYTIKVHALKSSAKLIGAGDFANDAQLLENAGKEDNTDYIDSHKDDFMKKYLSFKELLEPLFGGEKEKKIPEVDDELMGFAFEGIEEALKNEEYDTIDGIFEEMSEYSIPERYKERWIRIQETVYERKNK
ncbi:MAG: response regulator [Lachnospiraceae bacterium]|nr:response regulator [Lachnospiraceae bacterium]